MWSTASGDYGMTSEEADPGLTQSITACCPRQTIPDSCSCLEGCECICRDCDCQDSYDEDAEGWA